MLWGSGLDFCSKGKKQDLTPSHTLIDNARGVSLWGSDIAYQRELQRFAAGPLQHLCEDLLTAESVGDLARLAQQSHAYKGICGNLALVALSQACASLEQALQQQQHQLVQPRLQQLCEVASQTRQAIKAQHALNTQQQAASAANEPAPVQALPGLLQVLDQQLQNFGFQDEQLNQLHAYCQGPYQQAVRSIIQHTEDFDFNRAREQIAALLAQLRAQDD